MTLTNHVVEIYHSPFASNQADIGDGMELRHPSVECTHCISKRATPGAEKGVPGVKERRTQCSVLETTSAAADNVDVVVASSVRSLARSPIESSPVCSQLCVASVVSSHSVNGRI